MTTNPTLPRSFYLRLPAALTAAGILSVGAARAVWHLHDLTGMRHISGIWMTLAQALNGAVLYPPLEENGYYAGTRYMPLLFCLIAGAERVLGDYLLATKLVMLLALLALAAATFAVVRRVTGRWLDALALGGLILALPEGLMALLSPHADALAVALSVWGLFVLTSGTPGTGKVVLAALLVALAFATKFSALAAPAAAVVFLFPRQRRASVALAFGFGFLVVVVLGLTEFASHGRFADNFRALGSGGMNVESLRIGPVRLVVGLIISSLTAFVVPFIVPLALFTVLQHARTRSLTLWDWYFLASIATTLFIFTSPGTDINHLLELEIASVIVVAQRLAAPAATPVDTAPDALFTRISVLAALLVGGYVTVNQSAREWFTPERPLTFPTLAEQLPADPHLLTEDATPVVLLGQRPVVMDAFAFRLLAERGLIDDQALVERILRREFNGLILLRRVEDPKELLTAFHFGPRVTDALRQAYRFDRQVGQYYLYLPKSEGSGGEPPDRK